MQYSHHVFGMNTLDTPFRYFVMESQDLLTDNESCFMGTLKYIEENGSKTVGRTKISNPKKYGNITHMVHCIQYNRQLFTLSLFRLRYFQYIQFSASQLFPQFMQHLAIVQIFFNIFDNYSLVGQFVINPINQNLLQFLDLWISK